MNENLHQKSVPAEVIAQVQEKLTEVQTLLAPYSLSLTPSERQEIPKMGEKTVSFVKKAYEFATAYVDLRPPYLDTVAYDADMGDSTNLLIIGNLTEQIEQTLDDVEMIAGSEAYQASLLFYNYTKVLANQDIPNAKAVYDELKKRFPNRGRLSANAKNVPEQ
ncbi:MAG: hypothetical protein LBM07_02900 [Culturomica sp.]|jgi:hypothetical protein|nr:hypothetical protein [Culturomica sp.]